jgi:hypothetical protein
MYKKNYYYDDDVIIMNMMMLIMLIMIVFMILCIMILFEVMYDYTPRFEDYCTRANNKEYLTRIMINIVALGKKFFCTNIYVYI